MSDEKTDGAELAAVGDDTTAATPKRQEIVAVLAAFDQQFGTDGPERNSDSIGRPAGCDDCVKNIDMRAEHRAFVERVLEEVHAQGQLAVWQSFADFLSFDPLDRMKKGRRL